MCSNRKTIVCSILIGKALSTRFPKGIWESVYHLAKLHNLLPLIFHNIKQLKLNLPQEIESKFKKDYLWFLAKDIQRKKQLCGVINQLNNNNIDHILLKGSHLSETIYKTSALRPMSDIDILIHKSDFKKAYTELHKDGYRNVNFDLNDSDLLPYKDKHFSPLIKKDCLPIEFHWNIHRAYDYSKSENIWERAVSVCIDTTKTKVLSKEDLLIHICVHKGCDDDFVSSLMMLNDIKEIVISANIDWKKVYDIVLDEWENSKSVFAALYLYNKLLNGNIPDEFLKKIKPDNFNEEIEDLLLSQVFSTRKANLSLTNTFNAVSKIRGESNPLYLFKYLMSPRRICLRYNQKFSIKILPYLYSRRILEKARETLKILLCSSSTENKNTYKALRNTYKLKKWLHN